ncbi:MAG: (2Fe-2S)-binding protein [Cyclobacteriaceae bacterium]
MLTLTINDKEYTIDVEPDKPLLWVLREELGLTGAKYGCGIGQCGACTVHVDDVSIRSCSIPVSRIGGKKVTTIEGLTDTNHPILTAWEEENVPQCGYCQTGQIMSAFALVKQNRHPSDDDIDNAMSGNICRCGTYYRIRKAIRKATN